MTYLQRILKMPYLATILQAVTDAQIPDLQAEVHLSGWRIYHRRRDTVVGVYPLATVDLRPPPWGLLVVSNGKTLHNTLVRFTDAQILAERLPGAIQEMLRCERALLEAGIPDLVPSTKPAKRRRPTKAK